MIRLLLFILLFATVATFAESRAVGQSCPWKVSELGAVLMRSEATVGREARRLSGFDEAIADLRRAVLTGCMETGAASQLEALLIESPDYDAVQESETADELVDCMAEKKLEAARRITAARAEGDTLLEQRLLRVVAEIDAMEPRSWSQSVAAERTRSKLERLREERDNLIRICATAEDDF